MTTITKLSTFASIGLLLTFSAASVAQAANGQRCAPYNVIVNDLGKTENERGGQSLQSSGCIRDKASDEEYGKDHDAESGRTKIVFSELPCDNAALEDFYLQDYQIAHRYEMFANQTTGVWTLLNVFKSATGVDENGDYISGRMMACHIAEGTFYLNESEYEQDGLETLSQAQMSRHGNGDGNNEGYVIYADEGTGQWFVTRQISKGKTEVILQGDGFEKQNLLPVDRVWAI